VSNQEDGMKIKLLCVLFFSLSLLTAQSVVWSYYTTTGGTYVHFRATSTITDVDGDDHDDVITVSENDTLFCFSGISGLVIWRFAADPCYLERGLISVPDLDGDSVADVVLGTIWGTRSVFAISGADGSVIWQYDTHEYGDGGWIYEVAMMEDVNGDTVVDILASAGGPDAKRVYLFNGATGSKIWEYPAGYACYAVRAIGDISGDSIPDVAAATGNYVPAAYNVLFLDGTDGSLIRQVPLTASGLCVVPVGDIDDDTIPDVVCGTSGGTILALSGIDGSTIWTMNAGGMVWDLSLLPDVDNSGYPEILPSGVAMYSFRCLDAADGNTIWSAPAVDQIFVSVAVPDINGDSIWDVVGGTGYTSSMLYTLDGLSGSVIWQYAIGSPVESAYWIDDIDGNEFADILVGTRHGWFYAFSDGNVAVLENSRFIDGVTQVVSRFGGLEIKHDIPYGKPVRIEVYSILGQKMIDRRSRFTENPMNIDINALSAGIYFCRLHNEEFSQLLKFVVFD
jgi:outer membrane protein assembly factor BamB